MRIVCVLLAAFCAAATAHAQPWEYVHQPPLRGYQLIVSDQRADRVTHQWVLEGQTLLRWTRMVTLMRFADLARHTGPRPYLAAMRANARTTCPGAQVGPLRQWTLASYRMAQIRIDCPLNPASNRPETFFVRAIAGAFDLHVLTVSLRRVNQRDEFEWAERHMAGVTLCGPASREPACRAQTQRTDP